MADYLLTCSSIHAQARLDILKIHSRKMNLTRGMNLKKIADQLSHSSGAEIKGAFNSILRISSLTIIFCCSFMCYLNGIIDLFVVQCVLFVL